MISTIEILIFHLYTHRKQFFFINKSNKQTRDFSLYNIISKKYIKRKNTTITIIITTTKNNNYDDDNNNKNLIENP